MTQTNSLSEAWVAEPMGRVAAPIREQVIAALRQAILDFQLKPGQRLVERELIEQLGVSRTTIREALRELASEGLVTVVPQRGAMVSAPSLDEAMDLYEIRAALESLVVKHFVERASDDEVRALAATVEELAQVSETTDDVRAILAAKDKFYGVLIPGARSAALQQLIDGIRARVQMLRATSLSNPGRPVEVVAELRAVAEAIARRDADSASELCAAHVRKAAMTALHALQETDADE
ncbi:GntR family transcriptional regulator [Amnibacterium flavum]|uniref:GntR family transcriptional regulator n=1 Tax=Amnibacterium flavum TaxID=2173173 RepID=A0A2V1HUD4_9MICO|nr:GntR family transcriptional regulator [Amnibacterium flavum]PVZ93907.1 GntR family transcriptional regulator [Amnibacterium flavum]